MNGPYQQIVVISQKNENHMPFVGHKREKME